MKKIQAISSFFSTILILFSLSACCGNCLKTKEVKNILNSKLSVGDTRGQVELALNEMDIQFTYDKFQNRFQATIRDERCGEYQAISVYISLDASDRMSKIKVLESYTMP